MTEPIEQGALARVTEDTVNMTSAGGEQSLPKGFEFEVEDYVSAEEATNGLGPALYWGNAGGGMNNVAVLASKAEQAKSAEEMRARQIPTRQKVLEALSTALMVSTEDLLVDEIEKPNEGCTEFYGRAANGLPFGARIRVDRVWLIDD